MTARRTEPTRPSRATRDDCPRTLYRERRFENDQKAMVANALATENTAKPANGVPSRFDAVAHSTKRPKSASVINLAMKSRISF
ncbi:MAG: hypothetical protein QMB94_03660 [Phycisphaerales bacterium]